LVCGKELIIKGSILSDTIASVEVAVANKFGRRETHDQAIALPHMVFAGLFHEDFQTFKDLLLPGGALQLKSYWESMQRHPALCGHPVTGVHHWQENSIPISIHGDGVPITGVGKAWSKGMEIYSWSSCLAEGAKVVKNWLISMVSKQTIKQTSDTIWKENCVCVFLIVPFLV
jgi:hypothetical protein